jgi:hypothetical protein
LAATIELVSPRNKDRPRARESFVAKCGEHLRRGCGVVIVDVVTSRRANLNAELLVALGVERAPALPSGLTAVSYQPAGQEDRGQLLIWPSALAIGQPLPTVPLWLAADESVPLDLEASHTAACLDLRIRDAG